MVGAREKVLGFLRANRAEIARRFSVRRVGLFGSALRETAGEESDIDILVEFDEPTFDHYMDLKFFLEDGLGRKVDLVLADSLKKRLAPIILREVAYV